MKCSICTSKILRSAVAAGQVEQVIPLGRVSFSKKRRKKKFEHRIEKHIKRIKSDDRLQWADDCTTVPYGITVTGLAFWDDTQATVINSYTCAVPATAVCTPFRCPSQSASSRCRTSSWQTMSWSPTGTSRTVSRRSRRRSLPR